jgi:hypothetical protein
MWTRSGYRRRPIHYVPKYIGIEPKVKPEQLDWMLSGVGRGLKTDITLVVTMRLCVMP